MWLNRRKAGFRKVAAIALACALAGTLAACGSRDDGGVPGEGQGEPVATYQGKTVTDVEFNKYLSMLGLEMQQDVSFIKQIPAWMEEALGNYILYKEYASEATADDLKQAKEQAAAYRKQLKQELKDESVKDKLKSILDQSGLTVREAEKFKKMLTSAQLVVERKYEELREAVTEDDVREEFGKVQSDYNIVTVRHILVSTFDPSTGEQIRPEEEALARAKEVRAKLIAGGSWDELAAEYSDDPGSNTNGGLYEDQRAGKYTEAFKQAVNTQPIGVIGDPVLTEYGYHVILVEKREEMTYDKLEQDIKDAFRDYIANMKLSEQMQKEIEDLGIAFSLPQEETQDDEGSREDGAGEEGGSGESEGEAAE